MILTRTPLRISIGGGGTDLPSYYSRFGGFVISAGISHHIYVSVTKRFGNGYTLRYATQEHVDCIDRIQHPIIRETLRLHNLEPGIEIVSLADVPAGTGLGSSGAFTTGLLRAIRAFRREHVDASALAEEACRIEIDLLGEAVGKQDQYIAAYGGLTCFDFKADGTVHVERLSVSEDTVDQLQSRLLMFFTGFAHRAGDVLLDQQVRSNVCDSEMLDNLHDVKRLGFETKEALESGDLDRYALIMREHWERKRARSPGMSNSSIDHWYETGLNNGAIAGKLVGAGGGGFLLFFADDPGRLRRAMKGQGLMELRFRFDFNGSTVLVQD
jgi:D-glycero-alpha-D-manno-heptose-7-phosphate kinase